MITPKLVPYLSLALLLLGAGCANLRSTEGDAESAKAVAKTTAPGTSAMELPPSQPEPARLYKGTGQLVKGQEAGGGLPPPKPFVAATGSSVTLNFEAADLRDVVRNILGDIMNESYTIDATVGGTVTIRTATGIPREALPATLETLLRMNGATMVREGLLWRILPAANAVRGNVTPQLGNSARALPPGFSVQIVPLRYVGVRQMVAILEPFVKDQTTVRVDDLRNLLVLSGTELELKHLLDAIDMFDVNWIAGMSVGLFTLQSADVKSVMAEIDKAMGADPTRNPLAGILRIIPIERMNALLVVSPQPAYLDEAKKWIDRLDKGGEGGGVRFYVYQVQNSRAERIGPLLQQAFTGRVTQQAAAPPTLAPGTPAGQIVSPPSYQAQPMQPVATPAQPSAANVAQAAVAATQAAQQAQQAAAVTAAARGITDGTGVIRNIQVVADKDNNTILIVATPAEYSVIEAALKKLDVPQRQVVIEATIAEVKLTDDLQFGVEWLFKGGAPSGRGSGGQFNTSTPFNPAVPPASGAAGVGLAMAKGFNYLINNLNFPGGIQAALHLLDQYGGVKVLSNPHLSALDNQKATIKVGDRIPICQANYVGTGTVGTTTNGVFNTTAQYIDTGVLLQVTPHINAGGLVTLEVQAEVSVAGTTVNPCDPPPINTRSVQTLLAVPSGQTMVMGGLILEDKENTSSGLPLISRVPVLGGLFGTQELKNNRTELVMFITPRVVEDEVDYRRVIDNLRRRMEQMDEMFPVKQFVPEPKLAPVPQTAPQGDTIPDAKTAPDTSAPTVPQAVPQGNAIPDSRIASDIRATPIPQIAPQGDANPDAKTVR